MRAFGDLVSEAESADVAGWGGVRWLDGRAPEERPPWGYSRLLSGRLARVRSALDIDTGGGEVGAEASAFELIEFFLGPLPEHRQGRDPHREAAQSEAVGMTVTDLRTARCRMEFFDVGAIVWTLRKCIWWVPDFTVARYRGKLLALDDQRYSRHRPQLD